MIYVNNNYQNDSCLGGDFIHLSLLEFIMKLHNFDLNGATSIVLFIILLISCSLIGFLALPVYFCVKIPYEIHCLLNAHTISNLDDEKWRK